MTRILWLSPTHNHYKARFLQYLAAEPDLHLNVLAGSGRTGQGDVMEIQDWKYSLISCDVPKSHFGYSRAVRCILNKYFDQYDWVLIPAEKKNISLLLYSIWLRFKARTRGKRVGLFSYNHPNFKSKNGKSTSFDLLLTRFFYFNYNRVIFYSELGRQLAVSKRLISPHKAFYANNTIDNLEVNKYYIFQNPPIDELCILFIGRLIPSKKIQLLFMYYQALKQKLSTRNAKLKLEIIGDGPQNAIVKSYLKIDRDIVWHGQMVSEKKIAPIMSRCSLVFVPGASGLSINHAFAYGRPYLTIEGNNHGPEISYLVNRENGLLLGDDFNTNVDLIVDLLLNREKILEFCDNARRKGESLSIHNWVKQMKSSLSGE